MKASVWNLFIYKTEMSVRHVWKGEGGGCRGRRGGWTERIGAMGRRDFFDFLIFFDLLILRDFFDGMPG